MFTGLIERKGTLTNLSEKGGITTLVIDVGADYAANDGDSIAVNGCCLTVSEQAGHLMTFQVSRETLSLTNMGYLREGEIVNLERAMRLGDRLGGHMVAGHVDGLAELKSVTKHADGWALEVLVPRALAKYVIHKGSICLDGVSLTVNSIADGPAGSLIGLMLIPTTIRETTFGTMKVGWYLNLETDLVGKYVERFSAFESSTATGP